MQRGAGIENLLSTCWPWALEQTKEMKTVPGIIKGQDMIHRGAGVETLLSTCWLYHTPPSNIGGLATGQDLLVAMLFACLFVGWLHTC